MFGNYFYHRHLNRYVSVFGTLFNRIEIRRYDSDLNVTKLIHVPLAYAPKEYWLSHIQDRTDSAGNRITLPRMSYEMGSPRIDAQRQGNIKHQLYWPVSDNPDNVQVVNQAVAYTLPFSLNILSRSYDDGLQIFEQIAPYFAPSLSLPTKDIVSTSMPYTEDAELTLTNINFDHTWESDTTPTEKRFLIQLDFEMDVYLYGYVSTPSVIKHVITQYYEALDLEADDPLSPDLVNAAIRTESIVNPLTANVNSEYTITRTEEEQY